MKKIHNLLIIISVTLLYFSCNKQYDDPPVNQVPIGDIILISDLKDMFTGLPTVIDSSYSIYGNITTEETNGNFYKEAFMQDNSGAGIKLEFKASGGLYIGDSIRINVQGITMKDDDGLMVLENIDLDQQVVKIATEKFVVPNETTISQLSINEDQSTLIKLNNVEFSDTGNTYADAINLSSWQDFYIKDCNSVDPVEVRTSGYANFASDTVPTGNGSIVGIFTVYRGDKQLIIRDINEVQMDSSRCNSGGGDILYKDFDDGSLTSGGWKTFWSGTNPNIGEWEILFGNIAKASNYSNFNNSACESWLVSPNIDLNSAIAPYLIFDNDTRYNGPQLELWISSNYDGVSNPDVQGNWLELTSFVPNWDPDSNDWGFVSSGNIDLTQFISSSVTIAYKYIGTDSDGATWEVDNIIIRE
jgi:hypothetical protein